MNTYNVNFSRNGVKVTPLEALLLILDRTVNYNHPFINLKLSKTYMSRGNIKVINCFHEPRMPLAVFMKEWFGYDKESIRFKELDEYMTDSSSWNILYYIKPEGYGITVEIGLTELACCPDYKLADRRAIVNNRPVSVITLSDLSGPIRLPIVDELTDEQFCKILFDTYPELKTLKEKGYRLDDYRVEQHFRPSHLHRINVTDAEKKEFSLYYNLIYANFYKFINVE